VVDVSDDPGTDDFHPALAVGADGRVWLAWDVLDDPRRGRSRRRLPGEEMRGRESSLALACIGTARSASWSWPDDAQPPLAEGTLLSWSGGLPQLAFDPAGRLVLLHRYFEPEEGAGPPHSYPLLTRTLGADAGATRPSSPTAKGRRRAAARRRPVGLLDRRRGRPARRPAAEPAARTATPLRPRRWQKRGFYLCGSFGPARLQFAYAPFQPKAGGGPPLLRDRAARAASPRIDPLGAPESDPILTG